MARTVESRAEAASELETFCATAASGCGHAAGRRCAQGSPPPNVLAMTSEVVLFSDAAQPLLWIPATQRAGNDERGSAFCDAARDMRRNRGTHMRKCGPPVC